MRALPLLAITTAFLVAAPARADCQMTTSIPEVDTGDRGEGVPRAYVDNYACASCGLVFSIWTYQESNSVEGLQRGDESHDDTCGGAAGPGDTIIF
ncbi:MAG TPA: hypothetical protein VM370_12500 [Candidatus Thermoplasmatota archaeon]|nr:hypothetical protein [Candidatus Thermoplasmatota archaeon]